MLNLTFHTAVGQGLGWQMWPFGPGYGESLLPTVAKMLFVGAILGLICLFLRFLYGPKGIFRDHEMDREAEEMKAREREELRLRLEAGDIDQAEYDWEMKRLSK